MPTLIKLNCQNCNKEFYRLPKEIRRSIKRERLYFCSCACSAKYKGLDKPSVNRDIIIPEPKFINSTEHLNDTINPIFIDIKEYSIFRYILSKTKNKQRLKDNDLDAAYLKELWESQKGICPYTYIKMELYNWYNSKTLTAPNHPSLDRIDSSLGYIKGNVEFVCLAINYAKNGWSKQQILDFLQSIKVPSHI